MRIPSLAVIGLICAVATSTALAQESPAPSGRSATISGTGGLASGMHGSGPVLGGSVTFELNDWFAVEGSGTYLNRGSGAEALSANASLLVNVVPAGRRTVPYFAIGGGAYRASFDMDDRGLFGGSMGGPFAPGSQMVPVAGLMGFGMMQGPYSGPAVWTGPWNGATFTSSHLPAFYANRMGVMTVPGDGRWGVRSFTDPALVIGGGVRLGLTRHLVVRPDVRAITVFGGRHMNTFGAFSLNLGYQF